MRNLSLVGGFAATLVCLGLIAACDNQPKTLPGPTGGPFILSVVIDGPSTIAPGQSAQYTATNRMSDGTSQLATAVQWQSFNSSVLRVNASGLATAEPRTGEAVLSARVANPTGGTRSSTKEVVVVPDGTYRMVGQVTEAGITPTPVTGARIDVTTGTPLAATTDWDGRYRLYGVPAGADVRVTRDGYQPLVQSFQLTAHVTQNFQLALSGMRLNLTGPYTLAIDVVDGCPGSRPLPSELQHRRYDAALAQNGAALDVMLTESRFRLNSIGRGNRFSGRVDAAGATLRLDIFDSYYYPYYGPTSYPNVVEGVSDGAFLVVDGTAVTRGSPAGLSGELMGSLTHYNSSFPLGRNSFLGSCYSMAHRFTLSPR